MTPSLLMATTVHETVDAFLLPYVDHFRGLGWRVDVVAAGAATCGTCSDHADTAHETTWARRPVARGNGQAVRRLRDIQRRAGFDIVHVHTPVAALLARWALRPSGSLPDAQRPRLVYTAHGFHFDEARTWRSRPFELVERVAGQWTDHLVVINEEDHDWASRSGVVPSASLELMPGIGVDLRHYAATPAMAHQAIDIRRRLEVPEGAPVFTMVAEFIPRKRHVDAIEALARLAHDAHLILVGDGPLQAQTRTLAAARGLAQRCHFVDRQVDVRPWILAADALLLPSTREGLPRSILEAMALGVPVIGTQIRGTRSLLDDERGFLAPAAEPMRLADAMCRIVREPQETERRARRALAHVDTYDIRALLRRHEHVYEQLLSQRRPEPTAAPRTVSR